MMMLPIIIATSALLNPMPSTRIEPVIAPVMIIGKPSHTIVTEKALRRALAGTGSCSYSCPRRCSICSSPCRVAAFTLMSFTSASWLFEKIASNSLPSARRACLRSVAVLKFSQSAVRSGLVRNALDRAFLDTHSRSRERLHHFTRAFGIGDPFRIEIVRACRDAAVTLAGIDHAGIAAVHQLEEMVFGLSVAARVADQRLGNRGILDAVIFLAAFAERAAVKADDRGVTEIRVDAVETRGIGDRHIDVVGPRHRLGHQHLLILGGVHVAL